MGGIFSAIIIIIVVTIWVVNWLSSVLGNNDSNDAPRQRRSLEDWDELQARRRAELAQQSRQGEALEELHIEDSRAPGGSYANHPDPSQMTMAQRIELARQRARQQPGGRLPQVDERAEALRQARARAEAQARQQRAAAEQQQQTQRQKAAREQAERERRLAQRRRAAEKQAKQEREQQRQSRSRRRSGSAARQAQNQASAASTPSTPKLSKMRSASYQRVHKGHPHSDATLIGSKRKKKAGVSLGPLNAASLRKAFILKELLDQPLAMGNPQDDLLS